MSSNIESHNANQASDGLRAIDILKSQDRESAKQAIAAKVDGAIVDLNRPVAANAHVEAITPVSGDEALEVYRHSSAHLRAAAVLELFPGTKLGIGDREMEEGKVAVRNRVQGDTGSISIEQFADHIKHLVEQRSSDL